MKIYIDGTFYEQAEAKIPVFDHGFLYGDGVFEGLRIYAGRIFRMKEHMRRLYASARAIGLQITLDPAALETVLKEAVRINQKTEGYIRLIVSRGDGPLGVDPAGCTQSRIVVIVGDIRIYPDEVYQRGLALVTSTYRRIPADCFDARIKSLNYLNNVLAKIEAQRAGCLEAVMLDRQGFVLECTGDNLFVVHQGQVLTPPASSGALEGITRAAVMELAKELGLLAREQNLTRYDLINADECFLTGTAAEIMPVIQLDGTSIGTGKPGAVTGRLAEAFQRLVRKAA